jgi:hypothetical protein
MGKLKKDDKVRFKEGELKSDAGNLKNMKYDEVYTVSGVSHDGNVFLDGYGECLFFVGLFERVCCMCQKEGVYRQMRKFDKCISCAREYRSEMYKKVRDSLSPELLILFDEYHKAENDFSSIMILD